MSSTYEIGCVECCESIWVGQGTSEPYLYGTPSHLRAPQEFLTEHMGHKLVYYLDGCEPEEMQRDERFGRDS